jgi:hypothetical protein
MIGKKTRAVIATLVVAAATAGCELIVDFDRTKIDAGATDATVSDVTNPPIDAPVDSPVDAGKDSPADAPADVKVDTGTDAGTDASDAGDAADDAADATTD